MLAAQLVAQGRFEVVEAEPPAMGEGDVLVRSHRGSICGSDLHLVYDGFYRGEFPARPGFPGHEGVGVVEESRAEGFAPGDRVLAVPLPVVAQCFAQQQVVASRSLLKLPEDGDVGRLLMAQQLGTVIFAFRKFWTAGESGAGRTAAICGAGSAGLFFAQLARRAGFEQVIVADTSALRVGYAKEVGADIAVDVGETPFVDAVMDATGGTGADLVIEAVGYDATRIQCMQAARPLARVGYFGFPESPDGPSSWSYNEAWAKRLTIDVCHGTQNEPGLTAFREAIALVAAGEINVEPFMSSVYPLEQMQEAFEAAREQRGGKITVELGPL